MYQSGAEGPTVPVALPVHPEEHPVEGYGQVEEGPHQPLGVEPLEEGPGQVQDEQQLLLRLDQRQEAVPHQLGEGGQLGRRCRRETASKTIQDVRVTLKSLLEWWYAAWAAASRRLGPM